jgi:hypothetical protein
MMPLALLCGIPHVAWAAAEPEALGAWQGDEPDSREETRQARDEERQRRQEEADRRQEALDQEAEVYDRGTEALDSNNWDEAVQAFGDVVHMKAQKVDAALYWKAYALNRSGRRGDALSNLNELRQGFPASRWLSDAKALEAEIRQAAGQPSLPAKGGGDDDIQLLALNGLMGNDAERAVPIIEKLLQGNASPRVKDRALFVLSQNDSPRARALVAQMARGVGNPHVQAAALKYLGIAGDPASRQVLADVYASSTDVEIKKGILHGFMVAGDQARVLEIAKAEKSPELRRDAIRQLGVMGAHAELWQLYKTEPSVDLKKDMIQALFIGADSAKLVELAKTESNLELRRTAIRNLGMMEDTAPALLTIYAKEASADVKADVVQALFIQGNAKALVDLARAEKDPDLRKRIIGQLSHMDSKEGTDYLIEILNK